jgi:hypothetical protein
MSCRANLRPLRLTGILTGMLALVVVLGACSITASGGGSNQAPVATNTAAPPATPTAPPAATATPTVAPQANVIGVFSNAVAVGSNSNGTASASCASGKPLLGGGFIVRLDGGGEDGIPPNGSYPSSGTTWTVNVSTLAGSVHVTAIAVCLQANFAATMQIVQASNGGPDTTVACPSGSALTGGGFRSGGGTNAASQPSGNGWKVSTGIPLGGSASPTAYAVCATQGLKSAGVQSQNKMVTNGTVTSNGASCPAGQYPVGGGYNGYTPTGDTFWRVFLNGPETGQGTISSGWMAEVHSGEPASSAFTVYSVCATH